MRRALFLMWKELLELRLNRRMLGVAIVAPIVQLFLLGYAATTDVRNVPMVVADGDRSSASRELLERFVRSRYFVVTDIVGSTREIEPYLAGNRAAMALDIPPGYGKKLATGGHTALQLVADGTDSNSTTVALSYATGLIAAYNAELMAARPAAAPLAAPGLEARIRVWFNPQLESRMFMIPGILALLLLVITAVLGSMTLVREKELGTLEQLNVTPLKRWELIVGKLVPYAAIGIIDACVVIAVAVLWFEVPLRGSIPLLFVISVVYLLTTLGLGLFVSSVSHNQQQAMMTAVFFFFLPMIYLSGFIFPIENMPAAIQPITYFVPLRYYLVMVRGIFLKGVGLETFWRDALALLGWGVVILTLATLRSRKRLN